MIHVSGNRRHNQPRAFANVLVDRGFIIDPSENQKSALTGLLMEILRNDLIDLSQVFGDFRLFGIRFAALSMKDRCLFASLSHATGMHLRTTIR